MQGHGDEKVRGYYILLGNFSSSRLRLPPCIYFLHSLTVPRGSLVRGLQAIIRVLYVQVNPSGTSFVHVYDVLKATLACPLPVSCVFPPVRGLLVQARGQML